MYLYTHIQTHISKLTNPYTFNTFIINTLYTYNTPLLPIICQNTYFVLSSHIMLYEYRYVVIDTQHIITHITCSLLPTNLKYIITYIYNGTYYSRPSSVVERVIRNHKVEGSIPSAGCSSYYITTHYIFYCGRSTLVRLPNNNMFLPTDFTSGRLLCST